MDRQSIKINDKELINRLYNLKEEEITASFIYDLFGEFNGKAVANPYDLIDIFPGVYGPEKKKNKNTFTTTVGIWVFNKWFIEKELFNEFHYINKNLTGKLLSEMNQTLSYALMEDRINIQTMKNYLIKTQLVMPFVTVLSPNHSEKILTCTKVINKKKKELIEQYKEQLDAGDTKAINDVEQQLLQFAIDYIGEDPSMDTFLSESRSSIQNHFKNMYVMRGAIRDSDPNAKQEYNLALSNYMDGISADEYAMYCNSAAAGPYSRGKKTEYGGYMENLFAMGYQDIVFDKPGTDCGTTLTSPVYITQSNVNRYMYNNIVTNNGELVELNSKNMNKYIGKTVQMRFANLCSHEKPCNTCTGNFFAKLNISNVGLLMMQIPSAFKNAAMKAFHDSNVSTNEMDTMKAFGLK